MRIVLLMFIGIAPLALAQKVTVVAGDLASPFGVEHDAKGNLYIIEYTHSLRKLMPDRKTEVVCGNGKKGDGGDGGPAKDAQLNAPHAIAIDDDGNVFIADSLNHKIRRIDAKSGVITTIAGTTRGFSGDGGVAEKAQFAGIYCIAFNADKSKLVITDLENRRIRVMDMKTRVMSSIAGNGSKGVPKDGAAATDAPLVDPRAADMDSRGNVYILERSGHALRVVNAEGKIRTLIPPGTIKGPKHLWIDRNDDVIIADTDNHRIVKWNAKESKLMPLAGSGKAGMSVEPLVLNQPHGVYLDAKGAMYISDSKNNRVVKVE
jgi:hypothetical protein